MSSNCVAPTKEQQKIAEQYQKIITLYYKLSIENPSPPSSQPKSSTPKPLRYIFNGLQKTCYQNDYMCIMCQSFDCGTFENLREHYQTAHTRFLYKFNPEKASITFDLNPSPTEVIDRAAAFSDKCTTVAAPSFIVVSESKRQYLALNGLDEKKTGFFGAIEKRTYYDKYLQEVDADKPYNPEERHKDGQDFLEHYINLHAENLSRITTMNDDEKVYSNLWNRYLFKNRAKIGSQPTSWFPLHVAYFLQEYGNEIIRLNLRDNFILHMAAYVNVFGLIKPEHLALFSRKLENITADLKKETEEE